MNSAQVIERVLRLVDPRVKADDAPALRTATLINIPLALEVVARRVASDPVRRDLLRRVAPSGATVTNGTADLAANYATDKVLQDFIQTAEIELNPDDLGLGPFHWVGTRAQLRMKRPTDSMFICCAIENGASLYTRSTDGALDADLGAVAISANYIPTLAQLPFALDTEFLGILADSVTQSFQKQDGKRRKA